MDIARPDIAQARRRRNIIWIASAIFLIIAVTFGLSGLKPAAPAVERSTIVEDTVKQG